jgi:hypothetical protein
VWQQGGCRAAPAGGLKTLCTKLRRYELENPSAATIKRRPLAH